MCGQVQLSGLHPRSEELVELTRSFDRGRAGRGEMEKALAVDTRMLVQLQQDLEFEFVSDGALGWQDPLRTLAESFQGISFGGGYSRWFDTNTFYKKPVVTSEISPRLFNVRAFLENSWPPRGVQWKVSLPGPYTFSELSENSHYGNKEELLFDLARAEREIVRILVQSGVSLVQLSEPCLVYSPHREDAPSKDELGFAFEAIRKVVEGVQATVLLETFFGNAEHVLDDALELPIRAVGLDLYETDYSNLSVKTGKDIVLGIVDSRESHIESPEWIVETARDFMRNVAGHRISLAPNSDLKFLPRDVADMKVRVLAEAARTLEL